MKLFAQLHQKKSRFNMKRIGLKYYALYFVCVCVCLRVCPFGKL